MPGVRFRTRAVALTVGFAFTIGVLGSAATVSAASTKSTAANDTSLTVASFTNDFSAMAKL